MDTPELRLLFEELRQIVFDTKEKESCHENLTDVLELVAVAVGLKPAHLNGQGFRSEALLQELERLADRHHLLRARTAGIVSYWHRSRRCDSAIAEWKRAREVAEAREAASLLWLYAKPELAASIRRVVDGEEDVSSVLGYPECCVRAVSERDTLLFEEYVEALVRAGSPRTPDELIRRIAADTGVRDPKLSTIGTDFARLATRTRETNPFVSYIACAGCLTSRTSPTGRINRAMEDLAVSLSPGFATEIVAASRQEPRPAKEPSRASAAKVGRNAPCPCGSGRKYKKCHGAAR